jgi:hypothetical protein
VGGRAETTTSRSGNGSSGNSLLGLDAKTDYRATPIHPDNRWLLSRRLVAARNHLTGFCLDVRRNTPRTDRQHWPGYYAALHFTERSTQVGHSTPRRASGTRTQNRARQSRAAKPILIRRGERTAIADPEQIRIVKRGRSPLAMAAREASSWLLALRRRSARHPSLQCVLDAFEPFQGQLAE